ncbi:MAG: gamma-glutamylcyclotransferase [Opitutaceae bacterium]|nr:gamma-glutamylcyclotransferase [Opitutaceae bacterium]
MTRLFVYGTLKRGCRSHRLLANQKFLGEARTAAGFQMFHLGRFPGVVRAPDRPSSIGGEVFLVDDSCLRALDDFEGVSEGLYNRELVQLEHPHPAAYMYLFLGGIEGKALLDGDWAE